MTILELEARKKNFDTMLSEGRILRNKWTSEKDGKERACLLAAWSPEAGRAENSNACPAWIMPAWLAELTPWMDDSGSDKAWPSFAKRYGEMIWNARVLDKEAWDRAFKASLKLIVEDAEASAKKAAKSAVDRISDGILSIIEQEIKGATTNNEKEKIMAEYKEAVEYVALNDEPIVLDPEILQGQPTVHLLAIAYNRTMERAIDDVINFRKRSITALEIAKS